MTKYLAKLIFTVFWIGGYVFAQGVENHYLSLDEVLQIASDSNHQLQIARSQVDQAHGHNLESWRGFLPDITLSENFLRSNDPVAVFSMKLKRGIFTQADFDLNTLNNPDGFDNFTSALQVQQPLLNVDAFYGKSAASLGVKARQAAFERSQEAVVLSVTRAYYGLVLAGESLHAVAAALESARVHRDDAQAALDEGLINKADFLAAEVRLAELLEQHISAEHMVANASDGLKFIIAMDSDAVIIPVDTLFVPVFAEDKPFKPIDRSDVQALNFQSQAARRNVWMKRGGWIPRVNAFGGLEWHGSRVFDKNASNWAVGLQLQWHVFAGLGHFGRSKQASAEAEIVGIQYHQAEEQARMQVRKAKRSVTASQERTKVARSAVRQAEESLRIVEARFREGLEKTSDLLDKEVTLTNARLRLLKAKHDYAIAISELKFATGS